MAWFSLALDRSQNLEDAVDLRDIPSCMAIWKLFHHVAANTIVFMMMTEDVNNFIFGVIVGVMTIEIRLEYLNTMEISQ